MAKTAIYLDSNAGAPLHPRVAEALRVLISESSGSDPSSPAATNLIPNPSSIHAHGRRAKRLVAEAREAVARSLGPNTDPEQLVFTSSGTEANQLAIRSLLESRARASAPARPQRPHWITTPVEHDSTIQMIDWAKASGYDVSLIPVNADGAPDAEALASLIRPETALVSVVWVNNETGVIADVAKLAEVCAQQDIPLHLDAAQAWGKLPIDLASLGAKLVTFSAHKIGALAGTGVLWVGRGARIEALIRGKQEKSRRAGTENVLGIVAAGAAARQLVPLDWAARVAPLRDELQNAICKRIPGVIVNGAGSPRVANTLNLSFEGVEGEGLVMALDLAGYSVSSGSACSSGVLEPSHVLLAMGRSKAEATAAVRVSLSDEMPWETLEGFVEALEKVVQRVRKPAALTPAGLRVESGSSKGLNQAKI